MKLSFKAWCLLYLFARTLEAPMQDFVRSMLRHYPPYSQLSQEFFEAAPFCSLADLGSGGLLADEEILGALSGHRHMGGDCHIHGVHQDNPLLRHHLLLPISRGGWYRNKEYSFVLSATDDIGGSGRLWYHMGRVFGWDASSDLVDKILLEQREILSLEASATEVIALCG